MVGWGAALLALALSPHLRSCLLPRGGVGGVFLLVCASACPSLCFLRGRRHQQQQPWAGGGVGWMRVRLGRWSRR